MLTPTCCPATLIPVEKLELGLTKHLRHRKTATFSNRRSELGGLPARESVGESPSMGRRGPSGGVVTGGLSFLRAAALGQTILSANTRTDHGTTE